MTENQAPMASPRARLLEARRLVLSVLAELDTATEQCACADHRHFRNWAQAISADRLQGMADRLDKEAYGEAVSAVSGLPVGRFGAAPPPRQNESET